MTRGKKIALGVGGVCAAVGITLWSVSGHFKKHLEEEARKQVVAYLSKRFDSDVQFESIRLNLPAVSSLGLYFKHGRGVIASVDGKGLVLRLKNAGDRPPLLRLPRFHFDLDLAILSGPVKRVQRLECQGLEINVPPKEERGAKAKAEENTGENFAVVFDEIDMSDVALAMWPKDRAKPPLRFEIHSLAMKEAGNKTAMTYDARLLNAKPPGEIHAVGGFGPWNAGEPGDTPLSGDYRFDNADLSVFRSIRGILFSTGKFSGTLDNIEVSGEARVPAFALKSANNPISLSTHFEALVDGTNGDTRLKPVRARLGQTDFVTRGAIIKHEDLGRRSIELAVVMPNGDLRDILRLATPGTPFMKGRLHLDARITIPPANGKVKEKLRLAGTFSVSDALFLKDTVQDKVDELSRRGQGKPKNPEIDDVVSNLRGQFDMRDAQIRFSTISFDVPGAGVSLAGAYDLDGGKVDFHGDLRLTAKASQTMTGWKHWVVKPFDPIFSKNGSGTFLKIQVVGTASHPEFGRERGGSKDDSTEAKKMN